MKKTLSTATTEDDLFSTRSDERYKAKDFIYGLFLTKQARGTREATFYKAFSLQQDALYYCRHTEMRSLASQVIRYSDALEGTKLLYDSERGLLLIKGIDFTRAMPQYGQNSPRYYWNIVPLPIFSLKAKLPSLVPLVGTVSTIKKTIKKG